MRHRLHGCGALLMDSFEEWWTANSREFILADPRRVITTYKLAAIRAAYEAGQASRDGEVAQLSVRCEELKAALPLVREDTVVWPSIHDNVAALQASLAEALRNAEELEGRLAATTPVIEAAERRYGDLDETTCVHGNVTWNCESCDFDKDEAIVVALATYRAAVTKDDQK